MRIANAVAVAAMMTTPALAEPCKTETAQPMVVGIQGLSPQILIGGLVKSFDEAKHKACYHMIENPLLGNKFLGANVCIDMNGKPDQGMKPVMQMPNGLKIPMQPLTMEIAAAEYKAAMDACKAAANPAPAGPPAKTFVVPFSNWRYEI